jgi:hypothetical protein
LTNPEIAARLFIALNTVKAHAHNIYGKLGVRNRTQAVAKSALVVWGKASRLVGKPAVRRGTCVRTTKN